MRGHLITPLSPRKNVSIQRKPLHTTSILGKYHITKIPSSAQAKWVTSEGYFPQSSLAPTHTFIHMCWNIYMHTIYMTPFTAMHLFSACLLFLMYPLLNCSPPPHISYDSVFPRAYRYRQMTYAGYNGIHQREKFLSNISQICIFMTAVLLNIKMKF